MKYIVAVVVYLSVSTTAMAAQINGDSDFYPKSRDNLYTKSKADKPIKNTDLWQKLSEEEKNSLEKEGIYNADQLSEERRKALEEDLNIRKTPIKKGSNSNLSDNPFRQKKY